MLKRLGPEPAAVVAILSTVMVVAVSPAKSVTHQVIARSGDPIPGGPAGVVFDSFLSASLSSNGTVAFSSILTGPFVSPDRDIANFTAIGSDIRLIAREGSAATGLAPFGFERLGDVQPAANDNAFFGATLVGPGVDRISASSLWFGSPEGVTLAARGRDPVVGGAPLQIIREALPFGDNRFVAASGDVLTSQLVSGDANGLASIASSGDLAPGLDDGSVFHRFDPFNSDARLSVNQNGEVVFLAEHRQPDVLNGQGRGIWRSAAGALAAVAIEGEPAGGLGADAFYTRLARPVTNNRGDVAFEGTFQDASGPGNARTAIWSGPADAVEPIAISGEPALGAADGETFRGFDSPTLGTDGQVVFLATTLRENAQSGSGVWIAESSGLRAIANRGDLLPGLDPGATVRDFNHVLSPNIGPMINGRGDVVFSATSQLPGGPFRVGYWADIDGVLTKLAATGDLIDLGQSPLSEDPRTISSLVMIRGTGAEDAHASAWNDRREAVFDMRFTDGSEAIVVVSVIPEPMTLSLAIIGLTMPARRRWRHTDDRRSSR